MKRLGIIICTLFVTIFLTGCGMSPKKLINEMVSALEGKEVTETTTTMKMDMGMEAAGISMDMNMELHMDMKMCSEPYVPIWK